MSKKDVIIGKKQRGKEFKRREERNEQVIAKKMRDGWKET
jgi:hypothetical protein